MKHEIYPMRASEDGELLPAVVVDVPDVLYLQVVDTDDCEDFPAPSEPSERTFTTERLNASDVAYVPAARAERAEAEAQSAILAASDAERALANCRALLDALPALPIRIEARCCHCDKPATIARTYYDSGFPSAREHLCPEHADNHPWHGTAIPPVARPKPGIGWNDTAPGDGGEEAG